MQKIVLSIIICTYNREELLKLCLDNLLPQVKDKETIEVIVVDNNSSDNTKQIVQLKQRHLPSLKYILERKQGLSFARNRGGEEARGYFIGYIDDDAMIADQFMKNVFFTINNYDFDLFGGRVMPWFRHGQPRWLSNSFETNFPKNARLERTEEWKSLWGGVLFVKKEVFMKVGKFHTGLGMGDKMGYGEDTHFGKLVLDANFKLGRNPSIIIHHLVRREKLKLFWHFHSMYHQGKAMSFIERTESFGIILLKSLLNTIRQLLVGGKKWMFEPTFYWENYLLFTLKPIVVGAGKMVEIISRRTKQTG